MKRKQFLIGFYRAIGAGVAAAIVGLIVLLLSLLAGGIFAQELTISI